MAGRSSSLVVPQLLCGSRVDDRPEFLLKPSRNLGTPTRGGLFFPPCSAAHIAFGGLCIGTYCSVSHHRLMFALFEERAPSPRMSGPRMPSPFRKQNDDDAVDLMSKYVCDIRRSSPTSHEVSLHVVFMHIDVAAANIIFTQISIGLLRCTTVRHPSKSIQYRYSPDRSVAASRTTEIPSPRHRDWRETRSSSRKYPHLPTSARKSNLIFFCITSRIRMC